VTHSGTCADLLPKRRGVPLVYSGFTLASLMFFAYFTVTALINVANSAGLLPVMGHLTIIRPRIVALGPQSTTRTLRILCVRVVLCHGGSHHHRSRFLFLS
jgi:hypothetical protein